MEENLIHLDIASEFGAQPKGQRFAIYVPNKNQHGKPVAQGPWVEEGLRLLANICGGASAMPPIQGAWLNPQTQELIIEEPVVIYSYIEPETFALRLGELRDFIHRMGAETDQGQMAFEFDGEFYLIDFPASQPLPVNQPGDV